MSPIGRSPPKSNTPIPSPTSLTTPNVIRIQSAVWPLLICADRQMGHVKVQYNEHYSDRERRANNVSANGRNMIADDRFDLRCPAAQERCHRNQFRGQSDKIAILHLHSSTAFHKGFEDRNVRPMTSASFSSPTKKVFAVVTWKTHKIPGLLISKYRVSAKIYHRYLKNIDWVITNTCKKSYW